MADFVIDLHIQPRASKDEIVGEHGGRLKVRITAPPIDGKANAHLTSYLADLFGVPRRQVILLNGESGRSKRFRIVDPMLWPEDIERFLGPRHT